MITRVENTKSAVLGVGVLGGIVEQDVQITYVY
jgi:hypothetical protein